ITENHCRGLHLPSNWPRFFLPFVISRTVDPPHFIGSAIVAITPVGPVVPTREQRTVSAIKFTQLFTVSFCIFFIAVFGMVAVPCGYIHTKLHSLLVSGLHKFLHHVALSITPGAVGDVVIGRFCWPQTIAIVMLRYRYQSLKSAGLGSCSNLVGIKMLRIEQISRRIAKSPLFILKCGWRKVD